MQSFSIPLKSLDDLQKMTNFELYIYGGGSTQTLLEKWAQSSKETDTWRQKAYQKFIKTGLEDNDKLKIIFDEMLNGDISSNVALLNDEDVIGTLFEQSTYNQKHMIVISIPLKSLVGSKGKKGELQNFLSSLLCWVLYCKALSYTVSSNMGLADTGFLVGSKTI